LSTKRLGFLLAGFAFALYAGTLSPAPFPGVSSRLIVQHLGLHPFPELTHAVWGALARWVSEFPVGSVALKLNLFSALCGAAAVLLTFRLGARLRFRSLGHPDVPAFQQLVAVSAAGYLAVAYPVWHAATRAHHAALDLLLLLVIVSLAGRYRADGRPATLLALGLAYGIGMVEYATLAALFPIAAAAGCILVWEQGRGRRARATALATLGLGLGLAGYALAAWHFQSRPAYEWRGFHHLGQVVWQTWREQWLENRPLISGRGWLSTGGAALLPWLASALVARRKLRRGMRAVYAILLAAVGGFTLIALYNGPLAPWRWFGEQRLMLLPCLLLALAFGYAAGFAGLLLILPGLPHHRGLPAGAARLLGLAVAVLLGTAAIRNVHAVNPRPAALAYAWANQAVDRLDGRQFLVTDGFLDDLCLLAARERGIPLILLNTSLSYNPSYLKYAAAQFDDFRLKGLARIGLIPMLKDWVRHDPEAERRLAILPTPDLWFDGGRLAWPRGPVYLGVRDPSAVEPDRVFAEAMEFLGRMARPARRLAARPGISGETGRYLEQQLSRRANDAGVFLEQLGRQEYAEAAYLRSAEIRPDNASAIINRYVLLQSQGRAEEAAALWEQAESALRQNTAWPLPYYVQQFGHLKSWVALRTLQEVSGLYAGRPGVRAELKEIARMYVNGELDAARRAADELVLRPSHPSAAWVIRGLIARRQNDAAAFERSLKQLGEDHPEAVPLLIVRGQDQLRDAQPAAARATFQQALRLAPAHADALEGLLRAELLAGAPDNREEQIRKLLTLDPGNSWANLALGIRQYRAGHSAEAEASLCRSLERHPTAMALNNLAWILQERGADIEALLTVEEALRIAPDDYHAWDTRGWILMKLDRHPEAGAALQRARELNPDGIDAALHWAEWLLAQGRVAEAEREVKGLQDRPDPPTREQAIELDALCRRLAPSGP
jgi:tetratricopeptide (TPR) repeat protein